MKKTSILFMLLFFVGTNCYSQITKNDLDKMKPSAADKAMESQGYKLENGWTWKVGDTLYLGKGTLPTKHYAFIYESMVSWSNLMGSNQYGNDAMNGRKSLKSQEAARAFIKKFLIYGTKRGGYTAIAVVGLGGMANYWVEIDNAVESGEVRTPKAFAIEPISTNTSQSTTADELKKYKELYDSGAITKDEYEAVKKKLLGL